MTPIKPRGVIRGIKNGKKFEGEEPPQQSLKSFFKECDELDKRTERLKPKYDLAWTLPRGASKILQDAYFNAQKAEKGSIQRAQIIERAIQKVRRDYSSEFRYDPDYCCGK